MALLKLLSPLFQPSAALLLGVLVVIVCLIRGRHRLAAALLSAVVAVGALLALPWVAGAAVSALESYVAPTVMDESLQPSAIVVLAGAAHTYSSGDVGLNVASWRRLWRGIEIYHAYHGRVPLVYAGGSFNRRTGVPIESPVVLRVAARAGVEAERMVVEDGSTTTFESAQRLTRLWPQRFANTPRRIILVTSAWHMRRSIAVFRKAGYEVIPVATDYRGGANAASAQQWIPSLVAFTLTELAWREWASVLLYEWTGRS